MKGAYENTSAGEVATLQLVSGAERRWRVGKAADTAASTEETGSKARQKKDSGSARKEKQQIRRNVPLPESP
jgi:hypothetical protein